MKACMGKTQKNSQNSPFFNTPSKIDIPDQPVHAKSHNIELYSPQFISERSYRFINVIANRMTNQSLYILSNASANFPKPHLYRILHESSNINSYIKWTLRCNIHLNQCLKIRLMEFIFDFKNTFNKSVMIFCTRKNQHCNHYRDRVLYVSS